MASFSSFGKAFDRAAPGAFQQAYDASATQRRDKMQEQIQKAAEKARINQKYTDDAAQAGVTPVANPDGSINAAATYALITKAQNQSKAIQDKAAREAARQFELDTERQRLGLGGKPAVSASPVPAQPNQPEFMRPFSTGFVAAQLAPNPSNSSPSPAFMQPKAAPPAAAAPEESLERQVFLGQERARRGQMESDLQARNSVEAMNQYRGLFGTDPTPEHVANGNFTPAGLKAIADKKAEKEAMEARGVAFRYAMVEVENAGLDPKSPEGKTMFNRRLAYHTAPGPSKNAIMMADLQVNAGVLKPEQYDKEVSRLATFGGKVPQLSNSQEDVLLADNNAIANGADLIDAIDDFENRYGAGSFDKYTGPFDAKVKDIDWRFTGSNSPEERDARGLREKWNKILNQRIYDASGKAITMQEFERLQQAWGNIESAGFRDSLANFIGQTTESFGNRLDALQSYAVPESLKMVRGKRPTEYLRYGARINSGRGQAAPAPQAAPSTTGLSPEEQQELAELEARLNR